jgi:hypothetical protein
LHNEPAARGLLSVPHYLPARAGWRMMDVQAQSAPRQGTLF